MTDCSVTVSDASKNWPDGIISVKLTMSPYLLTLAEEASFGSGMKLWEFINVALWEKLGKPNEESLLNHAAELDLSDEDPKWKKRLKLTARHEIEVSRFKRMVESEGPAEGSGNGNKSSD